MSLIIPNTFATRTGTVQLSLLDDNFSYLTTSIDSISLLSLSTSATNINGAGGVLDTLLPAGEVSGYVLTTTGAGSYQWAAAPGGITTVGTRINTTRQSYVATASQTVFTLTGGLVYTPGSGQLRVYIDGVRQFPSAYVETSTTVFTLTAGVPAGSLVFAEIDGYVSYPIVATDISYTPAGGSSISATNVQAAISELETEKAPKESPTLSNTTFSGTISGTGVLVSSSKAFNWNGLTNNTFLEFTGIPSWVKRITVQFFGLSTNTATVAIIQIGSGSYTASGYSSATFSYNSGTASTSTAGFILDQGGSSGGAGQARHGNIIVSNVAGNNWVSSGVLVTSNVTPSGGAVTIGGVLDRIRVFVDGTAVFDAGTVGILYD